MLICDQFTHRPTLQEKDATSSARRPERGITSRSRISILFSGAKPAVESAWILLQEFWYLRVSPGIAAKFLYKVVWRVIGWCLQAWQIEGISAIVYSWTFRGRSLDS
jgi:hypothetical protein